MSGVGSASQALTKPSLPIELLPSNLAPVASHVHPILLLSLYFFRFSGLVANPVSSLLIGIVNLAVTQAAYCIMCLPPAGSTYKALKRGQKPRPGAAKKAGDGGNGAQISTVVISLILTTLAIPVLTILQILLGAPLTTHIPHTLLSSTYLALLAILPLIYVHGVDGGKWLEVISAQSPLDEVFGGAVGAFIGAWLGAVPIPLDWDREWQKWPVTVVTGCYLGYVVGKLVGGSLVKGKRIEFDSRIEERSE